MSWPEWTHGPDCVMSSQRPGYVRLAHCWHLRSFQKVLPHTQSTSIHYDTPELEKFFQSLEQSLHQIHNPWTHPLHNTNTFKGNTSSLLPQANHTFFTYIFFLHLQDWEVRCSISCPDCILTILTELEEVLVNFVQHCVTTWRVL